MARHRAALEQSSSSWLANCSQLPVSTYDATNTEGAARTGWIGFTTQQTERLVAAAAQIEAPLHALLLGSFVHCWTRRTGLAHVWVEVESHGRLTLDDSIDISRTVGWHTSTYPVRLPIDAQHADVMIRATTAALQAVQHLGVAYGLQESAHGAEPAQPVTALCFNYLGDINFSAAPGCALTASRYSVGRARGAANHRGHELKLSGRILGGCLVVDLSAPDTLPKAELELLMSELKQKLHKLAGESTLANVHDVVIEAGTRTGILSYMPQGLQLRAPRAAARDYRTVLLTGATGYVGAHVLMELLRQSRAHVLCLVRPKAAAGALQRLHETLEFYFQRTELQRFAERFTVLDGDAALARFGLDAVTYQQLCDSVDAVYHFAADTRLFGPEEEFQRNNVQPVRHCIEFVGTGCSKDLHHMSTLAVCGVNPQSTVIEFSEDSTDVGQEFQNHYEATKYSAEQLLQRFAAAGGRTFIYRSGNVSGDSRTARFQRAAGANRFVQLLAACVKLGKAPRTSESIVLSPIDQVAAGIVAISLDSATPGGIFHVDSPHEIAIERFFEALRRAGIAVGTCEHDSFASLFNAVRDTRATEIAVGRFWASRKPRNVRYNHARTLQLLQLLNRPFTELEEEWLGRFVEGLDGAGVFDFNPATVRAAATRNLAHPTSYARPAMTSNQA
jgi:thioester reductase-like protein